MAGNIYILRFLLSLGALLTMCTSSVSMETSRLCDELKKIDWRNDDDWPRAINSIESIRVLPSENLTDNEAMTDVIKQLEKLIEPEKMSEKLKSELANIGDADFGYIHPDNTSFYFFRNVQGSALCRYDIWAAKTGATLDPIYGPFDDDDCGSSIMLGHFGGRPIIVRIQYTPDAPMVGSPPWIVEAVFGNPDEWSEICRIDLEKQ